MPRPAATYGNRPDSGLNIRTTCGVIAEFLEQSFDARLYGLPLFLIEQFHDADLYDDTEFDGVVWDRRAARRVRASYAVRAWERLELMMSQLEKPQDRHRFFRFKMRAKRKTDSVLLSCLN